MSQQKSQAAPAALEISEHSEGMQRKISWVDVFWIVSGNPISILISIGSMAATIGRPSWAIWAAATLYAFVHMFIYAEMSSMFPNRSGGVSVYGAIALQRYGKIFAPLSVWCNWLGWAPSPAIVASIAGSYIVSAFFPNTAFANFSWTILDLSAILPDITLQLNGSIVAGLGVMIVSLLLQHSGVLRMARVQFLLAVFSTVPIFLLTLVPLLLGKVNWSNFSPFVLEGVSSWTSRPAFDLIMGGMFIATWTTFSCESCLCYVSEFKKPAQDTNRAIVSTSIMSFVAYAVLPFVFLGVLGMETLKDPAMVAGDPQVGIVRMAELVFGTGLGQWITIVLIMAMVLVNVTTMAGSSRTLYQSSVEGWLPKYLGKLNRHASPSNAMLTDFVFNVFLISLGSPIFVLAASNVAYLFGVVLNLIAAWIHRKDRPAHPRPYRAPDWLIYGGVPVLVFINLSFIIFGANLFAPNALLYGVVAMAIVVPVFCYRHFLVDKGVWPQAAQESLDMRTD
jgi:amino acid transporter